MSDCQSETRIFYGVENLLEIYSNNELPSPDWLVEFNELISDEQIEPKLLEESAKPRIHEKPNSHIKIPERAALHFGPPRTNYFKPEINKEKYFKTPIIEPPKSTEIWEAKPCEEYVYDGRRPIPKAKSTNIIKNLESEISNPEPDQPKSFIDEIKHQEIDSIESKEQNILITHRSDVEIDVLKDTSPPLVQDTFCTESAQEDLPIFQEPHSLYAQKENEKLEEGPVEVIVKTIADADKKGKVKARERPLLSNHTLSTTPKRSITSSRNFPKSSNNTPKYISVHSGHVSTSTSTSVPTKDATNKPNNNKSAPTSIKYSEFKSNRESQVLRNKKHVDLNYSSSISNYSQPQIEVTTVKVAASSTDGDACVWKNTEPQVATDFNEIIKIQQIEQNEEKKELIQKLNAKPKIRVQLKPKNVSVWNTIKSPEVNNLKDIMKEEQRKRDLNKVNDNKIPVSSKKKTCATNSSQVPDKEPLVKNKSSNDQHFWDSAVNKSNKK